MSRVRTPRVPAQDPETFGLPQELRFLRVLWALDHALQVTSKRMRATMGITAPQRLTLRIVDERGEVGAGEVASLLHLHPATLTGILERLSSRGYLQRLADPADARRARLRLTPKGRRLARPRQGTVEAAVAAVLRRFPADALGATSEVLTALAEELSRDEAVPRKPRPPG